MYGWKHRLHTRAQHAFDYWLWLWKYRNCELARKSFQFGARKYRYFVHPYNHTWANERAVEIPVVHDLVSQHDPGNVLEFGNVLSHYFFQPRHAVLDKYERSLAKRVVNQDIVAYQPEKDYDLIVSISTVEHVGWDERPRQPDKVLAVFPKLQQMLAPGGRAVITLPVGYNPFLDQCLREKQLTAAEMICMKRVSATNEWAETDLDGACGHHYGRPFPSANAVIFLLLEDPRKKVPRGGLSEARRRP